MRAGLTHKDAGEFVPKTTFTDHKIEKHLLSVRYEDWGKSSKTVRRIKKFLKEHAPEQTTQTEKEENEEPQYAKQS